jgi:hypothetical protein
MNGQPISILLFADSILGVHPYDWQCKILLNYEAGHQTAAACANFTGKTSTVFPIAALWTLFNFPRARLMYISATGQQVKNQFFSSLNRFRSRPAFSRWNWLETELRTPHGGFLFGRATDTGGNIEGLHDQPDSPACLLVDDAKSIRPEVLDALERCHTSYRLFMSSTGPAFGGFYQIMTAKAHLWRTFRIRWYKIDFSCQSTRLFMEIVSRPKRFNSARTNRIASIKESFQSCNSDLQNVVMAPT